MTGPSAGELRSRLSFPQRSVKSGPGNHRRIITSVVGITQILAWGSSYYLLAVLAAPISADTGWPLPWVVGGQTVGLLVAGAISPQVGKLIDCYGGRPVLAVSVVVLALGLLVLASAPNLAIYVAAWVMLGLGMGPGSTMPPLRRSAGISGVRLGRRSPR
ncbi:hypothetical protein [Methylorubrum zatmanii]|jgi:MFS family permease|uniref:MFS transporter n=1 Tax=Methylorubrum zatmanii TaxID=29429 RepID=A0ABW1WYI7_9HYPH|nr:hypothetical protein [Methylorubrum zatmanii]